MFHIFGIQKSMCVLRKKILLFNPWASSGRPDQANTGLTEPDWSGNFYRTEPDLTEPDLIAYKFSNIPSFKVSETLNYEN